MLTNGPTRLRRFLVSNRELTQMFALNPAFNANMDLCIGIPQIQGIPFGAKALSGGFDFGIQMFYVVIEHDSFSPVPDGEEIPCLPRMPIRFELRKIEMPSPDHIILDS